MTLIVGWCIGSDHSVAQKRKNQWEACKSLPNGIKFNNKLDQWVWKIDKDNSFSSRSLRRIIDQNTFVHHEGFYEDNKWLAIKLNFLHWGLLLNQIPNRNLLAKRDIQLNSIQSSDHCMVIMKIIPNIFLLTAFSQGSYGLKWAFGY